jgi:hypothetical protein
MRAAVHAPDPTGAGAVGGPQRPAIIDVQKEYL